MNPSTGTLGQTNIDVQHPLLVDYLYTVFLRKPETMGLLSYYIFLYVDPC